MYLAYIDRYPVSIRFLFDRMRAIPKMERAKTVILLLELFFEVGQVSQTTPFSTPTQANMLEYT